MTPEDRKELAHPEDDRRCVMSAHLSAQELTELDGAVQFWEEFGGNVLDAITPAVAGILAARVAAAVAAEREAWVGKIEALADAWADDTGIEGYINLGEAEDRLRALIAEARS